MINVAILPNIKKSLTLDITTQLAAWFQAHEWQVFVPQAASLTVGLPALPKEDTVRFALAVVLGGDGTILYFARQKRWHNVPLLGVNLGHLGFLSEVEIGEIWNVLPHVLQGDYDIDRRMMCRVRVFRENKECFSTTALNEVVVSKGALSRMIRLRTYIDSEYLETYPADGLIVATPTGSTAYSLSSGGPLVHPHMSLMLVTPIAAHALYTRPMIVPGNAHVRIIPLASHKELYLNVDGQEHVVLQPEDVVEVSRDLDEIKLIRVFKRSFYDLVHCKLRRTDI